MQMGTAHSSVFTTRKRFVQPVLTVAVLLVCMASSLPADVTATLSSSSLEFKMLSGQWPESQRVNITFSVNYDNDSTFRVHSPPEWLQLTHGLGLPAYSWILTQPYYIDVRPRGDKLSTAGEYRTKIIVELGSGKLYDIAVSVIVATPPPTPLRPEIKAITNAAYFAVAGFAPNSLMTIYGERLAESVISAEMLPLPKKLRDTEVFFCRRTGSGRSCSAMDLVFVSPTQINFLLKYSYIDAAPAGIAVVNRGLWDSAAALSSSSFTPISLNWISPGVFAAGYDCPLNGRDVPCEFTQARMDGGQVLRGTITDSDYRLITSNNPAKPGGIYVAWLTGLGNDGRVDDIKERLAGLRLRIGLRPPEEDLGSVADAVLMYAGASRDFPGLYQINFQIPPAVGWASGACVSGSAEIWLTLFGYTISYGIPVPLRASAEGEGCR
ncbi:MAG: hypothetical protein IT364_02765 [Candidatus Hydrogenedentes bacterium]|nr:hypothetical protein [Candidatus Hydrogenedentota bacterium]